VDEMEKKNCILTDFEQYFSVHVWEDNCMYAKKEKYNEKPAMRYNKR
jgi:hypothetical protein